MMTIIQFVTACAALLCLYLLALLVGATISAPAPFDWTDTGVGCLDDCLDPMDPNDDKEPIPF